MDIIKQKESDALGVYHLYWDSYMNGDLENFASTLDEEFEMIGTSESEVAHNKADGIAFYKAQMQELLGKAEMRNRKIDAKPVNGLFLVNEDCDIYVLGGPEWTFYSKIRISTLLHETESGWKVIQQHGSFPDMRVQEGETLALDKITKENLELRDAVKRRTIELENKSRELEIEAALERVRASTMAMHTSEDLSNVATVLFDQMRILGGDLFAFGIVLCDKHENMVEQWHNLGNKGMMSPFFVPVDLDYIHRYRYDQWKAGEKLFSIEIPEDYIAEHFDLMLEIPSVKAAMDEVAAQGVQVEIPEWEIDYGASFSHGYLLVSSLKPFKEDHIFPRFAQVFDQAYTRFLDLQKAEAQTREAQIQLSLERIRAKAMAMQHSDELSGFLTVVFEQFDVLKLNPVFCHLSFLDIDNNRSTFRTTGKKGATLIATQEIDFDASPFWKQKVEDWKAGHPYDVDVMFIPYESLPEVVEIFKEIRSKLPDDVLPKPEDFPDGQYVIDGYCKYGYLGYSATRPPSDEEKEVTKRIATEFGNVYQRFLDLQKAEAQAREAQIQLAMERVRARSMAMQKSEELAEISYLLNKQVVELGIPTRGCAFNIYNEHDSTEWFSNLEGTFPAYQTPRENIFLKYYEAGQRGESLLVEEFGGERIKELYKYFATLNGSENEKVSDHIEKAPDFQINHMAYFKYGYLVFVSLVPCPEAHEIFVRFAREFEQTYTRFLDLQKAEAQAKEAIKQASLDRVRGVISSMRSATDLELITPLIFKELTILGVPFIRCGVFIIHEKEEIVEAYLSSPDGNSLGALKLPFQASELTYQTVEAWRKGAVYRQHWNKEDFVKWIEELIKQDQIQDSRTYQGSTAPPESLDLHFIPFTQGMLYVGSTTTLGEEEIDLVKSLARAFAIAYARYEDFVKLDKAKSDIEEAMTELKATQSQLVQQEKLASLGQLTAGIAHEIKNPLNFVNNFSEVSLELVEEARDEVRSEKSKVKSQMSPLEGGSEQSEQGDEAELDKGKGSETYQNPANTPLSPLSRGDLILEILDDIEANLKKIHEHGSRANGIVTSMLMHSRGGDGKMEPSPLNPIIKEYVNLTFHGMRASKDAFNVDIQLDLDETIGEVPLVAEDFSRVILNLCNNAFDAMREKQTGDGRPKTKSPLEGGSERSEQGDASSLSYHPKLTVRTHQSENGTVTIEIEDNGPGIPEDIKDKILQPFFTTKKGTQGTGLGLSITNDIVKAHGGTISIKTRQGSGTTFTIELMNK